jgi:hypothetical protein
MNASVTWRNKELGFARGGNGKETDGTDEPEETETTDTNCL